MAGFQNDCAANFLKASPKAPYFHSCGHDFNLLALSKASSISEIHFYVVYNNNWVCSSSTHQKGKGIWKDAYNIAIHTKVVTHCF